MLVDTNVFVALLVRNTPWLAQARALYEHESDWRSEMHAMVELSSAFTRYVRVGEFDVKEATAMLKLAEQRFGRGLITVSHARAMQTALVRKVSAYDARFLVAAEYFGLRLTTEDVKLRRAAPELTQSLDEALTAA
ncbi:MAG: type II toxin-antitoxin system VapC family toxin [Gammaproteobacteria bacterium]